MRKWGVVITVAASACWGTPAVFAADDGSVTAADACGDMHGYVQVNDTEQNLPDSERTPRFDFKSVRVESTATGVRVSWTSCGPIGDADAQGGERAFTTSLGNDCYLDLDEPEYGGRTVTYKKTCYRDDPGPTAGTPLQDNTDERFSITLPASALKVAGDTMSVDLDRASFTGEAAQALAPGTTWRYLFSGTVDTLTAWGGGFGTGLGPFQRYGFAGPGGIDWADSDTSFTIR